MGRHYAGQTISITIFCCDIYLYSWYRTLWLTNTLIDKKYQFLYNLENTNWNHYD